jgi:hypothetical protein
MNIRRIVSNPAYLLLALIWVISVASLCFRAPVIQRDVELSPGEVEIAPPPLPQGFTSDATPTGASAEHARAQANRSRAPLWELGSELSLNFPLFATELGESVCLVVVVGLAYRFRSRLRIWYLAASRFIATRRRGTCIWLGSAVVMALAFFPPWVQVNTYGGRYPAQHIRLWHARMDRAPVEATRWGSPEVDYARMLTEIATGECLVLALYLTWARAKRVSDSKG